MTGLEATLTIASVAVRRMRRGRALWVGALAATLPIVFAAVVREKQQTGAPAVDVFAFVQLVLCVLPALFVASSIGEEIEDRTMTYLWSRPIPRWSVLTGKLVATVPVIWVLSLASWCLASLAGGGEDPTAASCLALLLGGTALSIIAAAIATLAPRHAMALTVCYMLFFDLPLGVMPAAIKYLSITHHDRTIANLGLVSDDSSSSAAIGVAVIASIWAVIGLSRIRRLEA